MALKSTERRVDELELNKQNTLVSGVTIKTINGNSVLGSGNLVISTASTITVGTTPVTSGTDGRVLMQRTGKVENSIIYENGLGDVIIPTVSTGAIRGLVVGGTTRNSNMALTLYNSLSIKTGGALYLERSDGQNNLALGYSTTGFNLTIGAPASTTGFIYFNKQNTTNIATFDVNLGHFGIGTTSPQARLDVRAQGALSTDFILRTRNSADTRNFLVVNGAGDVYNNGAGGVTSNTFYGENVGRSASGTDNTGFGISSLFSNTTGSGNSGLGAYSLQFINSGSNNIGVGYRAGRFIANGTTALTTSNNSIFIGQWSRANANSETNQIVIGNEAIGTGSNSVTLGNTSITRTNLRGQVVISGFASAPTGVEGAIYYDSTTKKHYGFDGTTWNALY